MHYEGPEELIRAQMAQAASMGDAVMFILAANSPTGRAICAALYGAPQLPPTFRNGQALESVPVVVPAALARELLNRHGGKAGAAITRTLTIDERFDYRMVWVQPDAIVLEVFKAGDRFFVHREPLGSAGPDVGFPFTFSCPLRRGGTVSVAVPTFQEGIKVVILINVGETHAYLHRGEGGGWRRMNDAGLASLLRTRFADDPANVARAVKALRTLPGDKDAWFMRVLNSQPHLGGLGRKVRRELAAM